MRYIIIAVLLASLSSGFTYASKQQVTYADNNLLVPIDGVVDGKRLDQYANKWWQWAKTLPRDTNAVVDTTGEFCGVNQYGKVWFLAGGYGTSLISRQCTLPKDKFIFFPIINMIYMQNLRSSKQTSCENVKYGAALNNDHLLSIRASLNGKEFEHANSFRIASKDCFDIYGLIDKKYNAPKWYPAATDGYWLMLKPLAPGKYTLKFQAQYFRENGALGRMGQDIEYSLTVK